jgi:hypothetical protein
MARAFKKMRGHGTDITLIEVMRGRLLFRFQARVSCIMHTGRPFVLDIFMSFSNPRHSHCKNRIS